jgi:ribosomal-protein-serine acetyltransferase
MNGTGKLLHLSVDQDLHLRQATPQDAAALYQIIDSQRAYLRQWLPFIDMSNSVSVTELYLKSMTRTGNTSDLLFIMVYQEKVAGLIGFKEMDTFNKKLEIGYWLSEKLQGNGIVRRSCKELVTYAFQVLKMNRVQLKVGIGNSRSSNIAKKLNFTFEGVLREAEFLNGRFQDLEVYSILRNEWENC